MRGRFALGRPRFFLQFDGKRNVYYAVIKIATDTQTCLDHTVWAAVKALEPGTCYGVGETPGKATAIARSWAKRFRIRSRAAAGERCNTMAREYGVHPVTIQRVVNRKSWQHI